MAKFKLQPAPTFKAPAAIPVAGGSDQPVVFTFKWRDREGVRVLTASLDGRPWDEIVMDLAEGWELEEEFNAENVKKLTDNYIGSGASILSSYLDELTKAKEKN